jgi:hypothetical protein
MTKGECPHVPSLMNGCSSSFACRLYRALPARLALLCVLSACLRCWPHGCLRGQCGLSLFGAGNEDAPGPDRMGGVPKRLPCHCSRCTARGLESWFRTRAMPFMRWGGCYRRCSHQVAREQCIANAPQHALPPTRHASAHARTHAFCVPFQTREADTAAGARPADAFAGFEGAGGGAGSRPVSEISPTPESRLKPTSSFLARTRSTKPTEQGDEATRRSPAPELRQGLSPKNGAHEFGCWGTFVKAWRFVTVIAAHSCPVLAVNSQIPSY